jgi:hypothetical protein
MKIEFTFARDAEYARRHVLAGRFRDVRGNVAIGAALLLVTLLGFISSDGPAMLGGLIAGSVAGVVLIGVVRRPDSVLASLPSAYFQKCAFVLDETGLGMTSDASRIWLSWGLVERVRPTPYAYLVSARDARGPWDIPRAALTPEQDSQLADFLRSRGLLAADGAGTSGRIGA